MLQQPLSHVTSNHLATSSYEIPKKKPFHQQQWLEPSLLDRELLVKGARLFQQHRKESHQLLNEDVACVQVRVIKPVHKE